MHTEILKRFCVNFANKLNIHGFTHLHAPHRHIFERVLAVLFIIGALGCLIAVSMQSWYRYSSEPPALILQFDYRNFDTMVPSVTMCPLNRINSSKFEEVFKKYNVRNTRNAQEFFIYISNMTYSTMNKVPDFEDVPPDKWLNILYELKENVISKTSFTWVITERGVCVSFDNDVAVYSSLEYWLANNWTVVSEKSAPQIYNYYNRSTQKKFSLTSHNYMVYVHDIRDVIDYNTPAVYQPLLIVKNYKYDVTDFTSSRKVRTIQQRKRKCKYLLDGGLKLWPVYTANMCTIECRYELIFSLFKCHPHFARPSDGIEVCGTNELKLIGQIADTIISLNATILENCGCVPNCDTTMYTYNSYSTYSLKPGSPVEAVFNTGVKFPRYKFYREELFGYNEFLATVGGTAGLFLGASVLSFIEIIYYFTLRLMWYTLASRHNLRHVIIRT